MPQPMATRVFPIVLSAAAVVGAAACGAGPECQASNDCGPTAVCAAGTCEALSADVVEEIRNSGNAVSYVPRNPPAPTQGATPTLPGQSPNTATGGTATMSGDIATVRGIYSDAANVWGWRSTDWSDVIFDVQTAAGDAMMVVSLAGTAGDLYTPGTSVSYDVNAAAGYGDLYVLGCADADQDGAWDVDAQVQSATVNVFAGPSADQVEVEYTAVMPDGTWSTGIGLLDIPAAP